MRVLRAEYYQGVRSITQELADRIKNGDISSDEDLQDALHQDVNGSYWVIYTHANFQVLSCSDHHDAYSEEYGQPAVEGDSINWAALAYAALMRDVQDQMAAEGVEVRDQELEEPHHMLEAGRSQLSWRASGRATSICCGLKWIGRS